jgi:glycosylphosphatidylinositol transamidase
MLDLEEWEREADLCLIALATIPAALYIIVDMVILRLNTAILGARYVNAVVGRERARLTTAYSIWVFLLLGIESIKTYRSNPFFE